MAVPIPRELVASWLFYIEKNGPPCFPITSLIWDIRRLLGGDYDLAEEWLLPVLWEWADSKSEDLPRLWAEADRPYRDGEDMLVLRELASIYHHEETGLWVLSPDDDCPPEIEAIKRLQCLFNELDTAAIERLEIEAGHTNPTALAAMLARPLLEITEADLESLPFRDRLRVENEILMARYEQTKAQAAAPPPRYMFETVTDLRNLPAAKWLVDKWIPDEGVGLVFGEYAGGKSFIVFDLLLHLAYGLPEWHGTKLPGQPIDVLLIAREGSKGFRDRIDAFKAHHDIVDDTNRLVFMRSPANFGDPQQFAELKSAVENCGRRFKVVAVDTVGRALPGEDFYDAKSITAFMERLQQLGEAGGGVAIGVHHVNKSGEAFGSVYFGASSDFMFMVEREGDGPLVRGKITCTKMKDGEDGWKRRVDYQKAANSLVVASVTESGDMVGKAIKLSDDDKLAFRALGEALKASGKLRTEMQGRTVTIDEWLEQCFKIGAVGKDAAKPWRDLHRRQVKLLANKLILVQDQLVRIIDHSANASAAIPMAAPGGSLPAIPPR
ncbi:hypothetical protein ACM42_18310 [Bradyrhizobium sp. CCBAU 25338]|nr:hypothetical protein [Bradyrhizobium sp. CCBAU 25338]